MRLKFSYSVLIFGLILLPSCKSKKNPILPETTDIVESVYASANIASADQYAVYSLMSGLLSANLVKEGDTVVAGQIIAQLDNANPSLNAQNARLALELSNRNLGNLDELSAQLKTARNQQQLDSNNFLRQQELWAQNIGTKTQLESRQLAYEASRNNLNALQTRYRQTRIQLLLARDQAQNNVNITARSSNDFSITSKINGRVYALNYKPGELVVPQQPIALVGRSGQFILKLEVDEVDISKIKLGQVALISMDAFPGKVFEGKISKILPNMDPKTQTFKVEAEFVDLPAALYPGLSAEVNIVIHKKASALVIPLEYLKNGDIVITNEGEKKVKTGFRSMDKIEILEGINKDTELQKPE